LYISMCCSWAIWKFCPDISGECCSHEKNFVHSLLI
jgi:hypothetical protein